MGTKLRVLQWIENNERSDLALSERIASLESILEEYFAADKDKTNKERVTAKLLSDLTGMSVTQARRYILIFQSSAEIKQAINEGKLENIKLIELICSIENNEHQKNLLAAALSGASFESIIDLKKNIELGKGKRIERRGRKKTNVSLGRVKPNIAKILVDALVKSRLIEEKIIQQVSNIHNDIDWAISDSVEKAFKRIMLVLEKGVV